MTDWSQLRIFFPGPTWVGPEVRAAMSAQALHHRTDEFRALHARAIAGLRPLLFTSGPVFLLTASGTGGMELAVRNLSRQRILSVATGAFGERWHRAALDNGKEADLLGFDWGRGARPEAIAARLATGHYDLVTLVHNETSTGAVNPLAEIAAVVRRFPDVLLAVDAVSSFGGVRIEVDALGLDLVFAGVQKCLALPPGLTVVAASPRAIDRARGVRHRGTYFDLVALADAAAADETPFTPSVSHIAALVTQLERVAAEGIDARFARHRAMADRVRDFARRRLALFAEEGHRSDTVTAIASPGAVDLARVLDAARDRGYVLASGYGRLKGSTFRVGHMGDHTVADVAGLVATLDDVLDELGRSR